MKKSFKVLIAIAASGLGITTISAYAGGGLTHGGTAIVCRNPTGEIVTAELLDLFEARELFGLHPIVVTDVANARNSLLADLGHRFVGKSLYPYYLRDTLTTLHGRFKVLAPRVRIELIPDVFPTISQKGCAIEQLASFQDGGDILLDSEIFGALSPLNRLALELHESVYFLDRKWARSTDSVFSRKLVGLLLANQWTDNLDKAILAYAFNFPRSGRYSDGFSGCTFILDLGTDGSVRIRPESICLTVIPWDAFGTSPSAIMNPTGVLDVWEWWSADHSSELGLKRSDSNNLIVNQVPFHWVSN
jgi:hypothetical protein